MYVKSTEGFHSLMFDFYIRLCVNFTLFESETLYKSTDLMSITLIFSSKVCECVYEGYIELFYGVEIIARNHN